MVGEGERKVETESDRERERDPYIERKIEANTREHTSITDEFLYLSTKSARKTQTDIVRPT